MKFAIESKLYSTVSDDKSNRLARRMYSSMSISNLIIEKKGDNYRATSDVSYNGYDNHCELEITPDMQIHYYTCDCIWCTHSSGCSHIGAFILYLSSLEIDSIPIQENTLASENNIVVAKEAKVPKEDYYIDSWQERIIQGRKNESILFINDFIEHSKQMYDSQIQMNIDQTRYDLLPFLEYDYFLKQFYLSYKIGNGKHYAIKNISVFLKEVQYQEFHRYGKKLAFVHSSSAFSEEAKRHIDFMKSMISLSNDSNANVTRYIIIDISYIDLFYQFYQSLDSTNLDFILTDTTNYKIDIHVQEEKDAYVFNLLNYPFHITGKKHGYILHRRTAELHIERFILDEQGIVIKFLNQFKQKKLWVPKQKLAYFEKYIWFIVEPYVQLQGSFPLHDLTFEGKITLVGDIDEQERIFIRLEYECFDQTSRHGFAEDNSLNTYHQDIVETYIKKFASEIDCTNHIAYMDINNEKTFEFMQEGLPFLDTYCEIYVSNALRSIGKTTNYKIQVGVRVDNDLLAVDIHSIGIPTDELQDVLRAYRRKKKFHRLRNGHLLNLESDELSNTSDFLNHHHISLSQLEKENIQLSTNRMFAIEEDAQQFSKIDFQRSSSFENLLHNFRHIDSTSFPIPSAYKDILRDYQKEGYRWLRTLHQYQFHGILADDMGLGKTLQVIVLLDSLKQEGSSQPSLVVCPSSLLYNWESEIHKFSTNLTCVCITGSQTQRDMLISECKDMDVLITSYDYIRRDHEKYQDLEFSYLILDEAQYIKNQKTKNAQCVKALKAKHRLALSGTPIENSLAELWSIFDFLMPSYLYTYHYFRTTFENKIVKEKNEDKQTELRRFVSPFIMRRVKQDVLRELPEKVEHTIMIDFSKEEEKLYLAYLAKANKELKQLVSSTGADKIAILALLTKLRQICCEPQILFENTPLMSSKTTMCLDLIQNLIDNKQKILLFSSFTTILDHLAQMLDKSGITYYQLTGKTKKEDRRDLVDAFQKDDTSVFLISLKAGGTGLNLTAAQAVIHFDPWWNISAQNQATDRAYRIGQHNNVQEFKLIMHNSIEERIQKMQLQKKNLADAFIEGNDGSISSMSTEELISLFK